LVHRRLKPSTRLRPISRPAAPATMSGWPASGGRN